jgi:hypothetical protein
MFSFEISASDIVEKQACGRSLFFKQDFFDTRLLFCWPIEIGIEIIFVKVAYATDFFGRMSARQPAAEQPLKLAIVRCLTLPSSRYDSRNR